MENWRLEFEREATRALESLQKALEASRAGCEAFDLYGPLRTAVSALQSADALAGDAAADDELSQLARPKKCGLRP